MQARHQGSVTDGGRNKFLGGAREVYLFEFESVDQSKKMKTKKKKGLQFKHFHKLWFLSQNSCDFSRILKWRKEKVFVPKVS